MASSIRTKREYSVINHEASAGMPLVLVVGNPEGVTRSAEALLPGAGYVVSRVPSARQALQYVFEARPDTIVLDAVLPDGNGFKAATALRAESRVGPAIPIVVVMAEEPSIDQRNEACRQGAWDALGGPSLFPELLAKLKVYVAAKREVDRIHTEALLDGSTGLYNLPGLARRAREMGSLMFRQHGSLACVTIALHVPPSPQSGAQANPADVVVTCVQVLKSTARMSDVLGRLGPTEFVILAPGTDAEGAVKLAERINQKVQLAQERASLPPVTVLAGYEAVGNLGYAPIDPMALVTRASAALRGGRTESGVRWIRHFDPPAA